MIVADAVAVRGNSERGHAFHIAGGEPAQAAVAERGVGLELAQSVEIGTQVAQRLAHRRGDAEIAEGIEQQAPDQEFEREVVDALAAIAISVARGVHPFVDDAIADGERRCNEPVVLVGMAGILADHVRELVEDGVAECGNVVSGRRARGRRGIRARNGSAVAGHESHSGS